MIRALLLFGFGLAALAGVVTQPIAAKEESPAPVELDFLAGDWDLYGPDGKQVGTSRIAVQAPGAVLFEERTAGDDKAQPLWFVNSERDKGWVQLFLGPSNQARAFTLQSPANRWPMILGSDVVLREGTPVKFRMTMSRVGQDGSRRLLEMSRDGGTTWATVFDYEYRRRP